MIRCRNATAKLYSPLLGERHTCAYNPRKAQISTYKGRTWISAKSPNSRSSPSTSSGTIFKTEQHPVYPAFATSLQKTSSAHVCSATFLPTPKLWSICCFVLRLGDTSLLLIFHSLDSAKGTTQNAKHSRNLKAWTQDKRHKR